MGSIPIPSSTDKPIYFWRFLLSFSEEFQIIHIADELVARFDQFFGFFDVLGCFADVFVIFEGYKLCVDESVFDVFVP